MIDLQGERITIEYIPLDDAVLWDANPKTHDIGSLCESILRYGFVDPPKFDAQLGAFVYGNGRTVALRMMRDQGKEPPRGILHDDDGQWYIPVKFGVDQASRDVARALAVDHNNLTLGGEFPVWDVAKMWDESYPDLLRLLAEAEALPVSVDGDDLDALLKEFDAGDGGDAPEAQVDRAAELQEKWNVELGQIWSLGIHRLAVGDCKDESLIAELMQGEKPRYGMHDPPYGINVVGRAAAIGGTKGFGSIGFDGAVPVNIYAPVAGDDKPFEPSHLLNICRDNVLWGLIITQTNCRQRKAGLYGTRKAERIGVILLVIVNWPGQRLRFQRGFTTIHGWAWCGRASESSGIIPHKNPPYCLSVL